MSETALKFGPEWLRALSHGHSVSSPPSSPGPVKFKLADYRYGREEMLALYNKDTLIPDGLEKLGSLGTPQVQEPLALVGMNMDEQRLWQRASSSDTSIRGSGTLRAAMNGGGLGRGRGGSMDRGRGRGRGMNSSYYSRGLSYDEDAEMRGHRDAGPPGMSLRGKSFERLMSATEPRGGGVSGSGPSWSASGSADRGGADGAVSPLKSGRAAVDNWRRRTGEDGPPEGGDRWRGLSRGGGRGGWRDREYAMAGDGGEWDDARGGPHRAGRGTHMGEADGREREPNRRRQHWQEDNLPEWATESACVDEKGGSFDATGAFHVPGSEGEEDDEHHPLLDPHSQRQSAKEPEARSEMHEEAASNHRPQMSPTTQAEFESGHEAAKENARRQPPTVNGRLSREEIRALAKRGSDIAASSAPSAAAMAHGHASNGVEMALATSRMIDPKMGVSTSVGTVVIEGQHEEDKLQHMESVADDLVAKLVSDEDDLRPSRPPPGGFMPGEKHVVVPPPEEQWFYTDPQGDIQGPFSSSDMAGWCMSGYFASDLLMRRQCDDKFSKLSDLVKVFGRLPFYPGPPVPPLKVSDLLNAQKAQAERERYELMQKQFYQQQTLLRQQQVVQSLQSLDDWNSLTTTQQQQLYLQRMMALPPIIPPTIPPMPASIAPSSTMAANTPAATNDISAAVMSAAPLQSQQQFSQDPIQAFMAQMVTASANPSATPSVAVTATTEASLPPSLPSMGGGGGEGPLQKLLIQLQRSSSAVSSAPSAPQQPSSAAPTPPTLGASSAAAMAAAGLDKSPDAIQSLLNQLSVGAQYRGADGVPGAGHLGVLQGDPRGRDEEALKHIEEEKRRFEERKRADEERIKMQEMRLQEERLKEEERRKELEAKNRRLEEELRRIQQQSQGREEDEAETDPKKKKQEDRVVGVVTKKEERRKQQELKKKKKMENEEAERKRREDDEESKRKEEDETKKREEEEKRKREDEKRKKREEEEAKRKKEEDEERKRQKNQEEEKKKSDEDKKRSSKEREEKRRKDDEEKRKLEEDDERKTKRELQEEMRREKEERRKEEERKRGAKQSSVQEAKEPRRQAREKSDVSNAWAKAAVAKVPGGKPPPPTKNTNKAGNPPSLIEIQKEAERESALHAQRQKEAAKAQEEKRRREAEKGATTLPASVNDGLHHEKERPSVLAGGPSGGLWSLDPPAVASWAHRAAAATAVVGGPSQNNARQATKSNNNSSIQTSGGFWDNPAPIKGPSSTRAAARGSQGDTNQAVTSLSANSSNKVKKKAAKEEGETAGKGGKTTFPQWCKSHLQSMKLHSRVDIPTFVSFLSDVDSPYEVSDYIKSCLGESKEVKEFAKQYLQQRAKLKTKEANGDANAKEAKIKRGR